MSLELLAARERAKRLLVIGALGTFYALGWLFFSWRSSRIAETECTVVRVPGHTYCTVRHVIDGKEHTLPWEACDRPTRWPSPNAVGTKLHCYYYRSFPADIFFEERRHRWFGPISLTLLVAALGVSALGLQRWMSAEKRVKRAPAPAAVYRAAAIVTDELRPPLSIPLVQSHWSRWLIGGPFLVLGIALAVLTTMLVWQLGGELDIGIALVTALGHGTTLAGAFSLFYRSGLVFDPEHGLASYWWGLKRPFFYSYASLAGLARVGAVVTGSGRATSYHLTLYFADGKTWKYSRATRDEAEAEVGRIEQYLWPDAARGDPGVGATRTDAA